MARPARARKQSTGQSAGFRHQKFPVALTIAGSDSSAGAGIQADLKTFSALGVYGLTAITCVVAEIPGKVSRIEPLSASIVREQIEVLLESFPVAAIKTGLLCSAEIVDAVAEVLNRRAIPMVVDPVMIATSGQQLLDPAAVNLYEKRLFPVAVLVTPNLDEAAKLLGAEIRTQTEMKRAAQALAEKYKTAILLKGGHLRGNMAVDLLFDKGRTTEFTAPFVRGVATHGTGCTYSAAITAGLASGHSLKESIKHAKKFVTATIRNHLNWTNESGDALHALNHSARAK